MTVDDKRLLEFLQPQLRDYGGKLEVEPGTWILFAVDATDREANKLATWLLAGAPFTSDSAPSEDDRWTLYFVAAAQREEAIHWLDETAKVAAGEIRPTSPAQRALIAELPTSGMPHRVAQQLAEFHGRGKLSAGCVNDARVLCALLDRLLYRDPLFYTALQTLLHHHLIDLVALRQELITEDFALEDELGRGALSRSPFPDAAQLVVDEIRDTFARFHIINPLDAGMNVMAPNPYAAFFEVVRDGDRIVSQIGTNPITLQRATVLNAIRATRRNVYWGSDFGKLDDTQTPWMGDEIANSIRFIRARLELRRDVSAIDGLFMLQRALESD